MKVALLVWLLGIAALVLLWAFLLAHDPLCHGVGHCGATVLT